MLGRLPLRVSPNNASRDRLAPSATSLRAAASRARLDDPIPWCPGWDTRELLRHLSEIHLWAVGHVARTAVTLEVDDVSNLVKAWPDLAVFWPTDDDLVGYYRDANANGTFEEEGDQLLATDDDGSDDLGSSRRVIRALRGRPRSKTPTTSSA